jgi:hypothetical protein
VGRWTPAQTGGRSLPQPADQQQFQRWSGMDDQQQPQERWQPTYDGRQVRLPLLLLPSLRRLHSTQDCKIMQDCQSSHGSVAGLHSPSGVALKLPMRRVQRDRYAGEQDGYADEQDRYAGDDAYSPPQGQQRAADSGSAPPDEELGSGQGGNGSNQRGRSGSRQGSGWGRPRDYDAVEDW